MNYYLPLRNIKKNEIMAWDYFSADGNHSEDREAEQDVEEQEMDLEWRNINTSANVRRCDEIIRILALPGKLV